MGRSLTYFRLSTGCDVISGRYYGTLSTVIPVAHLRNEEGKEMLQWKKAQGERLEKERIRKSICGQLNVLPPNLSAGTNEMMGNLNHGAKKMNFFLSFFLSLLF